MGREALFGEPAFEINTPHTHLHSFQLTLLQLLPCLDLNPHLLSSTSLPHWRLAGLGSVFDNNLNIFRAIGIVFPCAGGFFPYY